MNQNQGKIFIRKPSIRHIDNPFISRTSKHVDKEVNPFCYLSPRNKEKNSLSFLNVAKNAQIQMIKLSEQNKRLKVQVRSLKQQKTSIFNQNNTLKDKLKQYTQQLDFLKKNCYSSANKEETFQQSINQADLIIFNDIENLETMDDLYSQSQYNTLIKKNQFLQQNLLNSNKLVNKLRSDIQSANINLNMLQRKILSKDRQILKLKAKNFKKNLFELSSDEEK